MSIERVKQYFVDNNLPLEVIEFEISTATVDLAARALGVEPGRIAKTMALRLKGSDILILAKGDVKLDNRKFKDQFGEKAKFIGLEDVEAATGHPVGGVCPFGLSKPLQVYLDQSLQVFDYVFPAGGGPNTAVKIEVDFLQKITAAPFIDVCSEIVL
jgi:prolyl-tRNA editing enzyme YbaK/EbsC (Cys-tRNA(Pro) deacylase)